MRETFRADRVAAAVITCLALYAALFMAGFLRHAYLWNCLANQFHATNDPVLKEDIYAREWQAMDEEMDLDVIKKLREWNPPYMADQ